MSEHRSSTLVVNASGEGVAADGAGDQPPPAPPKSPFVERAGGFVREHLLVIFLVIGLIMGIIIGAIVRNAAPDFKDGIRNPIYLGYLGELFLRMLKGCIIPLVVSSLIAGMASLHGRAAGRIMGMTFAYYLSTMYIAVLMGIILVSAIQPGSSGKPDEVSGNTPDEVETADAMLDLGR